MDSMKLMKNLLKFIPVILLISYFCLHIDDALNPNARKWIDEYNKPVDLKSNAYIALISLNERLDYNKALKLYKTTLSYAVRGSIPLEKQLNYPNVKKLASVEDHKFLCDFKSSKCLDEIRNNKSNAELLVRSFKGVLNDYMELATLTNFSPLNSNYTEPNFDQLNALSKIATLDLYLDILDGKYKDAVSKLKALVYIDRSFMAKNTEALFDVLPIVNLEDRYEPIIVSLKSGNKKLLVELIPYLAPLSNDEFTMNRVFEASFALGVEQLKLKNIAHENIKESPLTGSFFAQRGYKQNMTINAMFEGVQYLILPTDIPKSRILTYTEEQRVKRNEAHKLLQDEIEKADSAWSLRYHRNPIGAIMLSVGPPNFLNLYPYKIEMDIRLLLLQIMIMSNNENLHRLIEEDAFVNPYNGIRPTLKTDNSLCYSWDTDICLRQ